VSALGLDDVVEWRLEDQRAHRPALGAAAHLQVHKQPLQYIFMNLQYTGENDSVSCSEK
jgi:hypothetical protein